MLLVVQSHLLNCGTVIFNDRIAMFSLITDNCPFHSLIGAEIIEKRLPWDQTQALRYWQLFPTPFWTMQGLYPVPQYTKVSSLQHPSEVRRRRKRCRKHAVKDFSQDEKQQAKSEFPMSRDHISSLYSVGLLFHCPSLAFSALLHRHFTALILSFSLHLL